MLEKATSKADAQKIRGAIIYWAGINAIDSIPDQPKIKGVCLLRCFFCAKGSNLARAARRIGGYEFRLRNSSNMNVDGSMAGRTPRKPN